jgi:membrane dipeptidase
LDAAFFAIYTPHEIDKLHPSREALEVFDTIYQQVEKYPQMAEMAFSPDDIRRIKKEDKRAILIGMENGSPVEGSLGVLRDFYRLGARYITLTHLKNNDISDSSTAKQPKWNGLSPFGKEVVKEMNRLGMIIDVSHISDKAFYDVLLTSKAPVIASHSCVRALCDIHRNMSDDMIKALAQKGGVIQINFYSAFLDCNYNKKSEQIGKIVEPKIKKIKRKYHGNIKKIMEEINALWEKYPIPAPDIEVLIDHIDHAVKLVGADNVGLGSDFDGAGGYPKGLENVTGFPLITYHLLKRGYSEDDITKILGGNFLRVFDQVTKVSNEMKSKP